jgi:hypothetical protein
MCAEHIVSEASVGMAVVYDLSVPGTWERACFHARQWGRLYSHLADIGANRIVFIFHPAPDPRWREWERVRERMILSDLQEELR